MVYLLTRCPLGLPNNASDDDAGAVFVKHVPDLLSVNKCPDFIVNKRHYFGTNLGDEHNQALILETS
jgi:hypothetical protein